MKYIKNILVLLLTLSFSISVFASKSTTNDAKTVFNLVNSYRVKHGLTPFKYNEALAQIAAEHSREMADRSVPFGHTGFRNRTRQASRAVAHPRAFSENVAYTDLDVTKVMNLWIESPAHRRSMLGNFNTSGIGVAYDRNGRVYATQIFLLSS